VNANWKERLRESTAAYWTRFRAYAALALGAGFLFVILSSGTPTRVGDGSEYYAMYLSWTHTARTWMNPVAAEAYSDFVRSNEVKSLVPTEWLLKAFPRLHVGDTTDFNHFWFYSFLAVACSSALRILGIPVYPHTAFIVLHWLLFLFPMFVAWRQYRWSGVVIVALMAFFSPVLWYMDKVHTEFFTFCLATGAVLLALDHKYCFAAVAMSLASTQNPSFAIIAMVLLALRVVTGRSERYKAWEAVAIAVTVALLVLHPYYYFSRHGVLTPQFLAGSASLSENLAFWYIWLFDPDLGLLPNWGIGTAVLVASIVVWVRSLRTPPRCLDWPVVVLLAVFLLVNIVAHSFTTNLNSGATPGPARYAVWYIPLFVPAMLTVLRWVQVNLIRTITAALIVSVVAILSVANNYPAKVPSHRVPTAASRFVQIHLPWLYNPPPEVFAERFSGDIRAVWSFLAVVGPDCQKILVFPHAGRDRIANRSRCYFDADTLRRLVRHEIAQRSASNPFYMRLRSSVAELAPLTMFVDEWYSFASGQPATQFLAVGWSVPEPWGVWSDGSDVTLEIPLSVVHEASELKGVELFFKGFARGTRLGTTVNVSLGTTQVWFGLVGAAPYTIQLRDFDYLNDDPLKVRFEILDPISPSELGMSADSRKLGIGLRRMRYISSTVSREAE